MPILDGDIIDGSTITTHSPLAIFFFAPTRQVQHKGLSSFELNPSPTNLVLVILSLWFPQD